MGNCFVSDADHDILRKSIPGSLLPEEDFEVFCKLCKKEMHTISSHLHLAPRQCFYIVISGEVIANLSSVNDGKPIAAVVFKPGELIHFFINSCIMNDGFIMQGNIKLSFVMRSKKKMTTVVGMDWPALEKFLDRRPHLTKFRDLFSLNLTNFLHTSSFLKGLSPSQVSPSLTNC